ncbi:keratin, type I cytoskeletal 12-like [Pyxicephalus adspersus]|uniref:keratin, type I cytoskeletal 12-like n=1 Tax=Pyxicephalus adspersus TaxID=30357 RepID=UPI003B5C553E
MNRSGHRRNAASGSDISSGNGSFGNQREGPGGHFSSGYSGVHPSGGSSVGFNSNSSGYGGVSRAGQGVGQGSSSRGYSSGGQNEDYDSGCRGYSAGSSRRQSGGQGGSSDGFTGDSSGGQIEGYTSGSSRYFDASREMQDGCQGSNCNSYGAGQSGGCGDNSGGYSGSFSGGQSGGYAGSTRGSSQLGGGYSGRQAGGHTGDHSGFSSENTAGSFRSADGFFSRGSNHQGFSNVTSNGGFGGISGGIPVGEQRIGFGGGFINGSLGAFSYGVGDGLIQAGEKETMQNLNSRLATYMDKVRALEDSNADLEIKIKNWYETHIPQKVDNTKYYKTIDELKDKIFTATLKNKHSTVKNDNARLAADDFRVKYESERLLYQNVDSDTSGLRKCLDDLTLDRSSLESQIESLREELSYLKKNHEEEMKCMQGVSGDVTVQVDAAPGVNILKILNDTRAQYEDLAEENRRKAEEEYTQKVSELNSEISHSSKQIESVKCEATELRRTMHNMELELQTHLAMKNSLENALAETEGQYCAQLAEIQDKVIGLEDQLAQLRNDMENQSREYKLLLDIRSKLENEIDMYRKLLDEEAKRDGWSDSSSMSVSDQRKRRLVTTITEERVNNRVVSTKVDKVEQNI